MIPMILCRMWMRILPKKSFSAWGKTVKRDSLEPRRRVEDEEGKRPTGKLEWSKRSDAAGMECRSFLVCVKNQEKNQEKKKARREVRTHAVTKSKKTQKISFLSYFPSSFLSEEGIFSLVHKTRLRNSRKDKQNCPKVFMRGRERRERI